MSGNTDRKKKVLTGTVVEVEKRSELHKFAVIPKRWIVERSFGWLDKYRILWKNCERYLENILHGWRKIKLCPEHPKKAPEDEIEASKKLTLVSDI